ncbi:hypothetical protein PHET_00199 [Paragonimus heterotremus]|uniref:Bardet-Biedl syndrome 1 N-terminal domain-containing protein n=1 Tax=Paragonimus heterotremus TaxID=100268 RepID=A0A8J4T5A8_9TREM|nr:hypothetical protein PHET_00199 [Paragonimus heterotremus]
MGSVAQWKLNLSDKWLLANCNCDAQVTSFSQCVCFGDPTGSGCNALCVVDFGTFFRTDTLSTSTKANTTVKLKVIAGMAIKHEVRLVDLPCGICTFNVLLGDKLIQVRVTLLADQVRGRVYLRVSKLYQRDEVDV